jgi:hypothetical protein
MHPKNIPWNEIEEYASTTSQNTKKQHAHVPLSLYNSCDLNKSHTSTSPQNYISTTPQNYISTSSQNYIIAELHLHIIAEHTKRTAPTCIWKSSSSCKREGMSARRGGSVRCDGAAAEEGGWSLGPVS